MINLELTIQGGRLDLDEKAVRQVMRMAGAEVAATARALIRRSAGGGRTYYVKGRLHQASAPGQPPVSISGTLARSIKVRVRKDGEGVSISDAAFYALFLEAGAKGGGGDRRKARLAKTGSGRLRLPKAAISQQRVLQRRPFLSLALSQRSGSIGPRITAAIEQGIAFKRLRP